MKNDLVKIFRAMYKNFEKQIAGFRHERQSQAAVLITCVSFVSDKNEKGVDFPITDRRIIATAIENAVN